MSENHEKIYTIYDRVIKRCLSLSEKTTVGLINGLYGKNYPVDSKVFYNWTEHHDEDLRRTLADTIITIVNGDRAESYHIEAQMTKDEGIVMRVIEYGFGHALKNRREAQVLRFPAPLVLYLYENGDIPLIQELTIDFGDQGSFCYQVPTVNYLSMTVEELNQKKLIVLIPFQLLRLRKEIERARTPENLEALKNLVQHDIIESIKANEDAGNITKSDGRRLKQMTLQLFRHIYARYEEMEKAGVSQMVEDALILDIDIIEHEHELKMKKLAQEKEEEKRLAIERKDSELQQKEQIIKKLVEQLKSNGHTPEEISQLIHTGDDN